MKKKQGFTLIELLAVIVILAVIALIATPLILNVINTAKKGAFRDSAYGIMRSAETYAMRELAETGKIEEISFTYNNKVETPSISGKSLEYKGTKPDSGVIYVNNKGEVKLENLSGSGWCANKDYTEDEITIGDCGSVTPPPVVDNPLNDILKNETVKTYETDTTAGLYKIDDRYYYRGSNPNNYITFNNEVWRIINIGPDYSLKIIRNDILLEQSWNDYKTDLNNYYNNLNETVKNLINHHTWNIGKVTYDSNYPISSVVTEEKSTTWQGSIGLMNVSDYIYSSLDSSCQSNTMNNPNCKNGTWLSNSSKNQWTMNAVATAVPVVHHIDTSGSVNGNEAPIGSALRPVLYLNSNIKLTGLGTSENPYTIVS